MALTNNLPLVKNSLRSSYLATSFLNAIKKASDENVVRNDSYPLSASKNICLLIVVPFFGFALMTDFYPSLPQLNFNKTLFNID